MKLIDPTSLEDWITPHSKEWYEQLGKFYGEYTYPWNSNITEPNGELIFDNEVFHMINNKEALDVGCGHGDFTIKCSAYAKKMIGFDQTNAFIENGKKHNRKNITFLAGNTKDGLPFETGQFDCAFIRKGPTSAYPELKRVVKKGGKILGLHPGDQLGTELPLLFPNLFKSSIAEDLILNKIKQRLEISVFESSQIQIVNGLEYLHTPTDVFKLRCFGQKLSIINKLMEENFYDVKRIFEQNSSEHGLPITISRYIVRATV